MATPVTPVATPAGDLIITSRSAHISTQQCNRLRYWQYEAPNGSDGVRGWQRKRLSLPLSTGSWTHTGVQRMLEGATTQDAVTDAVSGYLAEVSERGLELEVPDAEQTPAVQEQAALIEGLLWAFARVRLPLWLRDYEFVEVESEEVTPLAEDVVLASRKDALVRRKADNRLYVVKWEVISDTGDWWYSSPEKGIPLLVNTLGIERRIGEQVGVIVEGLIKGTRHAVKDEDGNKTGTRETSPLVYGYKATGLPTLYDCKYRRGSGWSRFKVWEEEFSSGIGSPVAFWVNWLPDELVESLFASVTIERNQQHIESFVIQLVASERLVRQWREAVESGSKTLDETFCQNVSSCRGCPMHEMCWQPGVATAPAASGLYIPSNDSVT